MLDVVHEHDLKDLPAPDEETLGYWVKLAFMTMRREIEVAFRKSGMTVTQWRALGVLLNKPDATHSDLMHHLDIEAPSVTSLVDGMERKGWVKRTRSSEDARVKRLSLTPQGRRLIEDAHEAMAPIEERMAATLTAGEQATLRRLLRTLTVGMHKSP
ncbi:MAG: MarR family winged helix-turn-helix transcriptional regulator [Spirochaetia bacterium]